MDQRSRSSGRWTSPSSASSPTSPTRLADAGVAMFAISTFDTDYLLVRDADAAPAIAALSASGHKLVA